MRFVVLTTHSAVLVTRWVAFGMCWAVLDMRYLDKVDKTVDRDKPFFSSPFQSSI